MTIIEVEARAISGPLSDGKLLSYNAVVKGRCARDAIPWTFHIEVLKCGQDNSDTITRIGDDSVELLDSCYVVFDTDDRWNFL